jgi:hypothetical protein
MDPVYPPHAGTSDYFGTAVRTGQGLEQAQFTMAEVLTNMRGIVVGIPELRSKGTNENWMGLSLRAEMGLVRSEIRLVLSREMRGLFRKHRKATMFAAKTV